MNDVDVLVHEKNEAVSVPYMQFMLLVGEKGDSAFYYFVEGYDAPYYQHRIRNVCELELIPIRCNGKSKVLDVYSLVNTDSYAMYKKAFFVDSDFDDNSHISEDVYVTPCYSVENFYVTSNVLSEILKCEFGVLPTDGEFKEIINLFVRECEAFHNAIGEFNAWYACMKSSKCADGISLDDSVPSEFVRLEIERIEKKYDLHKIQDKFAKDKPVSDADVSKMLIVLSNKPECSFRGKYEMQFFCKFLNFIIDDANHKRRRKYIKRKIKFQINRGLALSQLSHYADTPPCLSSYLAKRYS